MQVSHAGPINQGASATYTYDRADNRSNVAVITSWTSRALRTDDFNGDGRGDIFWHEDDGVVTDWLANADGTFTANWNTFNSNPGTMWHPVGIGDFNGDGRADIFWQADDGTVTDWLGNADGSFTANWNTFTSNPGTMWHVAGIGDFNGDGRADIFWQADDGTVTDWLGNADGSFTANWNTFNTNPGVGWHVVGVGDFNGDGRADILWRNDNGQFMEWTANSDGSFSRNTAVSFTVDPSWKVVGVGDFNCDGYADILWRNDNGDLTEWQATSSGNFLTTGMPYYGVATNLRVALIGDFNGDHCDDLLWRDTSGNLSEWLGSSTGGFISNPGANTSVPTIWSIEPR